jgi:hypothetical protein
MLRSACLAGLGQLAKLLAVTGLLRARAAMLVQRLMMTRLGRLRAVAASLLAGVRRLMLLAALQQKWRMSWWLTEGEASGDGLGSARRALQINSSFC